jgi:hypothetical protein
MIIVKRTAKKPGTVLIAVFKWHKYVVQERKSLEGDEHTGKPRMVKTELKIQKVSTFLHANCSHAHHKILSDDLNMPHFAQHSVPHVLTHNQCDNHMSTCADLIGSADKVGPYLSRIITRDKIWRFLYNHN